MTTIQQSHILWRSEDNLITLIDIPRSISSAQGTCDFPCQDVLLSTKPQERPYPTNEPKSAAARAKLVNNTVDAELHGVYAELLAGALAEVKAAYDRAWCQPRNFDQTPAEAGDKRKLDLDDANEQTHTQRESKDLHRDGDSRALFLNDLLQSQSKTSYARVHGVDTDDTEHIDDYKPSKECDSPKQARQKLTMSYSGDQTTFFIPPRSSFILGSCGDPNTLHRSVRAQAQELDVPKEFDFILLDPPWPNRSVRRTHKTANSTYSTVPTLDDLYHLIMGMDLDVLMSDNCLIAIWITNKPAIRDLILGEDGVFNTWGVELVEEWIWLKTTIHGEPVTPINSVWRKPYEVLLVGRKRRQYYRPGEEMPSGHDEVKRRVLMSVPDLHSRKPCLKELIETLVANPQDYRALEVFARHLVAGWWSWGDECIKLNWEGFWQYEEHNSDAASGGN